MTVNMLITVTDINDLEICTLSLDTIRVGFPTAKVRVWVNNYEPEKRQIYEYVVEKCKGKDITVFENHGKVWHHAEWIKAGVNTTEGKVVIVDGDCIFWKSCEDFDFASTIAGMYIPIIYNEFAKCISFERLHTSFLWIRDTKELRSALWSKYPWTAQEYGEYCPCDPFMPSVKFIMGKPMFWDTCSMMYNMIGGTHFGTRELECFDHINSASFSKCMQERMDVEFSEGLRSTHEIAKLAPEKLKGHYKHAMAYYMRMSEKAMLMEKARVEEKLP